MSTDVEPGAIRPPGDSTHEYLLRDSRPVPEALLYNANDQTDSADIPIERYTSAEFARLEMEKLWYRVWQMACFEHEIPEAGDHLVYDIGDRSYIIMRTRDGGIRAFVNACLHRARVLRDYDGNVPELRCSFHGWTWNLDGSIKDLPCRWDFPHLTDDQLRLPEAAVGTWRGLVFINPDPNAGPLADFLKDLDSKWIWPIERRYKNVHVKKVLPLNWKAAQEAFMESYHAIATHPQILTWTRDATAQVDATEGQPNWNRMIVLVGVPSPHVEDFTDEQDVVEDFFAARSFYSANPQRDVVAENGEILTVPEGRTAREMLAEETRTQLSRVTGQDFSEYSDCELLDTVQYTVFPNFHPWGGFKTNICYRWRPNGFDPDSCIFETMLLADPPVGEENPKPAEPYVLREDERFCEVDALGMLGPIFDQDIENMQSVQRGMKATRKSGISLAQYQESRIRHMHQELGKWMEK